MRDTLGAGVRPMGGAERVVHIDLAQRGQLAGKVRIVGFLFGMESQILQEQYLARLQSLGHGRRLGTDAVGRQLDRHSKQLAKPDRDRAQAERPVEGALGTPEVGHQHDLRAMVEQIVDGGQERRGCACHRQCAPSSRGH